MTDAKSLYERDFAAWTKQQAKALRAAACRSTNQAVDWEHLAEELPDSIALASADLDDYRELDAAAQARIRQSGYSIEQILENWFPPEPPQYASGR